VIQNILAGDYAEFQSLMDKYQGMVYSQAIKSTRNPDEAEDLTQEVFVKAFEKLSTFKGEALFSTWLFKIAQNEIIKRIRKNFEVPLVKHEDLDYLELSAFGKITNWKNSITPELNLIKEELKDKIRGMISNLPALYKKPLTLYYFEEMSYKEISEHLNLKMNTLKSYIFRGKEILKEWLKDENEN